MSCFLHRMQRKEERRNRSLAGEGKVSPSGVYACSKCHLPLFDSDKQFDAGAGFPSFWQAREEGVKENFLDTYGRERIQLLCSGCGQHLGHLFANRKTPSRLRYCIKHEAIELNS